MSTDKNKELFGFGARLIEERLKLGFTQKALAAVLEKTSMTQIKYESEETKPDLLYLAGLHKLGADIYYIVTGIRSANAIAKDEIEVLDGYRALDIRGKAGVLGMITGLSAPQAISGVSNLGKVGQQIVGDITGSQAVNLIGKKTKK
ncbi:helix-turn-helix domain-containing protein [Undibacterium sp. TC4M20W]|uniref:helix-turn-helix domain-containing protein n=1 Tax=Undibacterium sp. TC4M20W TaxID=3413052 RepID=UPI003BF3BB92